MNVAKRLAKVLGSFVTGYSGGLALTIPIFSDFQAGNFEWFNIFVYPMMSGLIVSLPQLGKVLNEIGDMNE